MRKGRVPRQAAAALRAGSRTILVTALLGALIGLGWGLGGEAEYRSVASVVFADREDEDALADAGGAAIDPGADDAVPRLVELAASRAVAEEAAALLSGTVSGADLLARVVARAGTGRIVEIVATADSPDYAAAAADAYAEALTEVAAREERRRIRRVEEQLGAELAELAPHVGPAPVDPATGEPLDPAASGEPTVEQATELAERIAALERVRNATEPLIIARAAELPDSPAESRSAAAFTAAGLLIGVLVGLLLLAIRELTRRPIREPGALARAAGTDRAFTIGATEPLAFSPEPGRIALEPNARQDAVEIAGALGLAAAAGASIAVAAAERGRTATSLTLALAVTAAEEGLTVICVETEMERPLLAHELGIEGEPGLAQYLVREAVPREVMHPLSAGSRDAAGVVVCVPGGGIPERSVDLLESSRFAALIDRVTRVYDLALFIAPPLSAGGAAQAVIRRTDGTILAARRHRSSARVLARGRGLLSGIRPPAAVLVGPETPSLRD